MPLYQFKCKQCGKFMDYFYHMEDVPEEVKCTRKVCNGYAKRLMSNPSLPSFQKTKSVEQHNAEIMEELDKEDQVEKEKEEWTDEDDLLNELGM